MEREEKQRKKTEEKINRGKVRKRWKECEK